jgi:hypothetical protein
MIAWQRAGEPGWPWRWRGKPATTPAPARWRRLSDDEDHFL